MMHLVLHVGAHGTDEGRIAAWLARNRSVLAAQGVLAPPPGQFVNRVSEALDLGRDADPAQREEALLRGLGASGSHLRMVISAPGLLGSRDDALAADGFYRRDVARRLHALAVLFGRSRLSVLLAVRRAQQVIPPLLPDAPEAVLGGLSDPTLPWARLGHSIRTHLPRASLVVWRHEAFAQVWPDVVRALVGPEAALPMPPLFDLAAGGLGAEARVRAQHYVTANPPRNARHLAEVLALFARRYGSALPDGAPAHLPVWVNARLAQMDQGFDSEWAALTALPGVRAIQPAA